MAGAFGYGTETYEASIEMAELSLLPAVRRAENTTIIVVTHDIESAIRISDTLWLLGRNRDASGAAVGGASIQQAIDLAGMGLAWDRDIESRAEFRELAAALKARFATL